MKPGDRIRAKAFPEYEGTIVSVKEDRIELKLDKPIKGSTVSEGFTTLEEFEQIFELIGKSDWASLWDDSSS